MIKYLIRIVFESEYNDPIRCALEIPLTFVAKQVHFPKEDAMATIKTFLTVTCFLMLFLLLPARLYAAYPGAIYISFIKGDVQMQAGDTTEWMSAALNTPVLEGDKLWVPRGGRVEMHLIDGSYVRLDGGTSFDILTVQKTSFQFYLGIGHAYIDLSGGDDTLIQMDTPVSSVRAYDRSKFRVDVIEDGYTMVSVFRGLVYTENRNGRTTVSAGETLSLNDTSAVLSELGPADEWEQWNRDRDRRLAEAAGPAEEYLPGDLEVYSESFDHYGRWVYVTGYGYCWTPSAVPANWAPYRLGRWVWMGGDYVWISHEPWGWVPFHYGRWLFSASIGWCWVPPARDNIYWGPGYVAWVHSSNYVSWCALGPGETYYGHGHFGRHSVDISRAGARPKDMKRAYRNIHVRNAVTVVPRRSFAAGRMETTSVRENPFLMKGMEFGRPRIKPARTSSMPVIKKIPERDLPPRSVRVQPVPDRRKTRPLVRERDESVFKPGVVPKRMFMKRQDRELYRERPKVENRKATPQGNVRREAPRATPERRLRPEERRAVPVQRSRPEAKKVAPGKSPAAERAKSRLREEKREDGRNGRDSNDRGTNNPRGQGSRSRTWEERN
jgi:hypothetical protein